MVPAARAAAVALATALLAAPPASADILVRARNRAEDGERLPEVARERARRPWRLEGLAADCRRLLAVPPGWQGSPPVADLTSRPDLLRALAPIEAAARSAAPGTPEATRARLTLAGELASRSFDEAAAAEYLALVAEQEMLPAAWNGLAALARRQWRLDLARDVGNAVLDMDPENGMAHFQLALLDELTGRLTEADEHYLRALEADPSLWVPHVNPLVVGNARAERALHHQYLRRGGPPHGVFDSSPAAAAAPPRAPRSPRPGKQRRTTSPPAVEAVAPPPLPPEPPAAPVGPTPEPPPAQPAPRVP